MATEHHHRHDDEQRSALRRALIFPPPARNPFVHVLALGALGQGVGILYGPASAVRAVQITQDLRRAHRLLQERGLPPED
jgi:hypothetical protein